MNPIHTCFIAGLILTTTAPAAKASPLEKPQPAVGPLRIHPENPSGPEGQLRVEWIHPQTGASHAGPLVTGGSSLKLEAPFAGEAILYLCGRE